MKRTVTSHPDILYHAINDAINRFTRDILIAKGFVAQSTLDEADSELASLTEDVIASTVAAWRECEIDDEA